MYKFSAQISEQQPDLWTENRIQIPNLSKQVKYEIAHLFVKIAKNRLSWLSY